MEVVIEISIIIQYTRKNLTSCQQVVFATSLSTSCSHAVIFSSCTKFVTHNLLTSC